MLFLLTVSGILGAIVGIWALCIVMSARVRSDETYEFSSERGLR
jgi:hypothetical protein